MKVLIIGGYGVFGERLARLLTRDKHDVCIAGRSLKAANTLAHELGCRAMQVDRNGDLSILKSFDVVVDAAGPFHTYGAAPYQLVHAAIKAGTHYLDLSDNADFCEGISALDHEATQAGVCAISGLSTVPALSSAVVHALADGDHPRVIDCAVLPGNRSPRGFSVMHSILAQAGQPMQVWRGGRWAKATGWSEATHYTLPQGLVRQGWQIEVPDNTLFPKYFGADTVLFRAGLELWTMRYGLAFFATLRRFIPIPVTKPVVLFFKFLADALTPFGGGRGGMSVRVIAGNEHRWWRLLAEDGDGPFIPAVSARALLRRPALPIGARPALCVITLEEAEAAMSDLKVITERDKKAFDPIFPRVLGEGFAQLPKELQNTHITPDRSYWLGRAMVTRGSSLWSRLIGLIFGFPPASPDTEVEVTKTVTTRGETWERRFGTKRFRSHLAATKHGMTESFGPFSFLLDLTAQDGSLQFNVRSCRIGPIALPKRLLPNVIAREYVDEGLFHFDVTLKAPLTDGLIVRYPGSLSPAEREQATPPERVKSRD